MKTSVLLSSLVISVCCAQGQPDVKVWTRLTGSVSDEYGYAAAVDNSGNVVIAGATQGSIAGGNAGRYDMFVAKYNSAGTRLWVKQRGTAEREFAYGVAADPSGNIYTTGYTGAALDGQTHAGVNGDFDVFLMKHDASGNWQWTREFGFGPDDEGRAVATDRFGNVYVTGYVRGALDGLPRPGSADVFLRKYDSAGNKLWSALFGSADVDESFGITCDAAGNVFVTGWCSGSMDGITPYLGNGDNFLAKYDPNGQQLWLKQWGTFNKDTGYSLATDAPGNVYVSGYSTGPLYGSPGGNRDVFLAKFDPNGNLLWGKKAATSGHDQAWGAATDPAGNVYITGETAGALDGSAWQGGIDIFLSKYDPAGNRLWTSQYGTAADELARGIAVTTNGVVYLAGYTTGNLDGNANLGATDPFVMKLSPAYYFPPLPPTVSPATGVSSNVFTANWSAPGFVNGCRLDVSTNATFSDYLAGYQDLDVGNVTHQPVTGLIPMMACYYRVRAYNTNGTSGNSGTMAVTLAPVDPCLTILNSDFENGFSPAGGGTFANSWTEWKTDPSAVIGFDETATVHGGAHSQRVQISGGANGSSGGVYQRVPAVPGHTYTLRVWIYAGDDQTACYLGVDPAGGTNANAGVSWSSATTNVAWVQKTWTGIPTAGLLTVYFKVASSDATQRNGYFDDVAPGISLSVQRSGDSLTMTWPTCPAASLEQTDDLTEPAIWTTPTNQVNVIGGQNTVILLPTDNSDFFRLVLK